MKWKEGEISSVVCYFSVPDELWHMRRHLYSVFLRPEAIEGIKPDSEELLSNMSKAYEVSKQGTMAS